MGRIVETLGAAHAPATFFLQGRWSEAEPAMARRIADDGHLVGNHSHYHARMTLLSDSGIRSDVEQAEAAVSAATGVATRPWFRCPFGDGFDDPRVVDLLRRSATGTCTGTWSWRIGSRGGRPRTSHTMRSKARSVTATARWSSSTRGRIGRPMRCRRS